MAVLENTRFEGTLTRNGMSISVSFDVAIDNRGVLQLSVDPLPISAHSITSDFWQHQRRVANLNLVGQAANGSMFSSDRFFFTSYSHSTQLCVGGTCSDATLEIPLSSSVEKPQLIWRVRQLRTFRHLERQTSHGTIVAAGAEPGDDRQALTGWIAIEAPGGVDQSWWATADHLVEHVGRIMSLASGTYLRPYIEQRLEGASNRIRVLRRSNTADPFMPPFHFLNLESILQYACNTYPDKYQRMRNLDGALQWLLAPAHYDEGRLVSAMTALENIVNADPGSNSAIMKNGAFKKIAKIVRELLKENGAPALMLSKVPELNRLALADSLSSYINKYSIVVDDFPENSMQALIKARNNIIHKGYYFDDDIAEQTDIWNHIIVARELATRILLSALGFKGNYFSHLHNDRQLSFPDCRLVTA